MRPMTVTLVYSSYRRILGHGEELKAFSNFLTLNKLKKTPNESLVRLHLVKTCQGNRKKIDAVLSKFEWGSFIDINQNFTTSESNREKIDSSSFTLSWLFYFSCVEGNFFQNSLFMTITRG